MASTISARILHVTPNPLKPTLPLVLACAHSIPAPGTSVQKSGLTPAPDLPALPGTGGCQWVGPGQNKEATHSGAWMSFRLGAR